MVSPGEGGSGAAAAGAVPPRKDTHKKKHCPLHPVHPLLRKTPIIKLTPPLLPQTSTYSAYGRLYTDYA